MCITCYSVMEKSVHRTGGEQPRQQLCHGALPAGYPQHCPPAITENMGEGFLLIGKGAELLSCNASALRLLGVEGIRPGECVLGLSSSTRVMSRWASR